MRAACRLRQRRRRAGRGVRRHVGVHVRAWDEDRNGASTSASCPAGVQGGLRPPTADADAVARRLLLRRRVRRGPPRRSAQRRDRDDARRRRDGARAQHHALPARGRRPPPQAPRPRRRRVLRRHVRLADGTACADGALCYDGSRVAVPTCGDGVVEAGEECDDGAADAAAAARLLRQRRCRRRAATAAAAATASCRRGRTASPTAAAQHAATRRYALTPVCGDAALVLHRRPRASRRPARHGRRSSSARRRPARGLGHRRLRLPRLECKYRVFRLIDSVCFGNHEALHT